MVRITSVEAYVVSIPLDPPVWLSIAPILSQDEVVVRLRTDNGLVGIGEIHGAPLAPIAETVVRELGPLVVGEDPLGYERLWARCFARTHARRSPKGGGGRGPLLAAMAGVDIAIWDLVGQALGQPLWRLLGGSRDRAPIYATGGYYGPGKTLDDLARELRGYVEDRGYRAVKMKVGGAPLAEDLERVRVARQAVGPDVALMVDANQAWDFETALAFSRAAAAYDLRWIEEPVQWQDDIAMLARLATLSPVPLAAGELESTRFGCRDLVQSGAVRVIQYDTTMNGGITEGRKVGVLAEAYHVGFAPHHDPQIHIHLVCGLPNGLVLETFPDPARDPIWDRLFSRKPAIERGEMLAPTAPGLGLEIDEAVLRRYGTRVE